jgi:hypothetical protein
MTFVYILFNEGLAKAYIKQLEDNTQYLQTQIWGRSCPNLCLNKQAKTIFGGGANNLARSSFCHT